jgi:hypothetical protein
MLVLMASSLTAAAVSAGRGGANPLAELAGRFRRLEARVQAWMAKLPTHIEVTVTTAFGTVQGGMLGWLIGMFAPEEGAARLSVPYAPPGLDRMALGLGLLQSSAGLLLLLYSSPLVTDLHEDHQFWLISVIF